MGITLIKSSIKMKRVSFFHASGIHAIISEEGKLVTLIYAPPAPKTKVVY